MNVPVLFLVFNRPDTTQAVFDVIRASKPPRLYVACDGPRASRPSDVDLVRRVQEIATKIDWPCAVYSLFRDKNLGCRRAVSGALDWFFSLEERGIVLEDDCVVDETFFPYAEELLEKYENDERVMTIGALHAHGKEHVPSGDYFFSRYNHCTGWASWRRAWKLYDHDMADWPALRKTKWLCSIGDGNLLFEHYWKNIFDKAYANEIDSWAYRWTFSCWAQRGLTILPSRNLVRNIGFGDAATHTKDPSHLLAQLRLESVNIPLRYPRTMIRDIAADEWTDRNLFGITYLNYLKHQIHSMPGGGGISAVYKAIKRFFRN